MKLRDIPIAALRYAIAQTTLVVLEKFQSQGHPTFDGFDECEGVLLCVVEDRIKDIDNYDIKTMDHNKYDLSRWKGDTLPSRRFASIATRLVNINKSDEYSLIYVIALIIESMGENKKAARAMSANMIAHFVCEKTQDTTESIAKMISRDVFGVT